MTIFAFAPATVKPATDATRSGATITSWPLVEYFPAIDILDSEASSWEAFLAEEQADEDQWSDEFADEQAGLAAAESHLEMGLIAW